jgi:hypothetical protein
VTNLGRTGLQGGDVWLERLCLSENSRLASVEPSSPPSAGGAVASELLAAAATLAVAIVAAVALAELVVDVLKALGALDVMPDPPSTV